MLRRVLLLALATLLLTACSSRADGGRVQVAAGFYPLAWAAQQVGGPQVRVVDLTVPGVEPHDLALDVRQTAEVSDADLVLYEKGFQPAVDTAVEQNAHRSLEVGSVVDLEHADGGVDPHFWQDPVRMATYVFRLADELARLDPAHAGDYRNRASHLVGRLRALDRDYTRGLAHCRVRTIVVSHDAFGYLGKYGLKVRGIAGLTPDAEPSAKHIAEIQDLVRSQGITTVFSETLASPKLAHALAHDLGVRSEVLDPIEGVRADAARGTDYLTLMRANLSRLQQANGCR